MNGYSMLPASRYNNKSPPGVDDCRAGSNEREKMNTRKIARSRHSCKSICDKVGGLRRRMELFAVLTVAVVAAAMLAAPRNAFAGNSAAPSDWVTANLPQIVELYQYLHSHPELSMLEEKTAARMADELRAVGAKVSSGIGGYGVVGVLENGPGKVLMLRADMDALPVAEDTKLPYASKVFAKDKRGATLPVMHACGHDLHMANLVGVARYLAANRNRWSGTAVFLFQPAEELGGGAQAMIDDGLFDKIPRPDYAVALHVASEVPTGQCTYLPGYALANVDSIDITVKGRGGHGAYPETTIDPIVIAAKLVLDLQTIVSREMKPTEPAVITVGSIHGGTKHNIISDECRLQVTGAQLFARGSREVAGRNSPQGVGRGDERGRAGARSDGERGDAVGVQRSRSNCPRGQDSQGGTRRRERRSG